MSETPDYSAPPHIEYEGREYEVRLTFRCPTDLTEEQLWQWLEFEWGARTKDGRCSGRGRVEHDGRTA